MRFHRQTRRIFIAPALGLVLAAAMTACSTSSSNSNSSTAPTNSSSSSAPASSSSSSSTSASAASQITANWEAFFNSSTAESNRLTLLQNGSTFASAVQAFAASPLASAVSAKVDAVKVTSATAATVTYDLTAAGQTVEKAATGVAVYQDGTWKVGDSSFCGLLKSGASLMNIKVPAACS
jgi:hypothetical protein